MDKPYPGMDKRLTKREALEGKEWHEEETEPEGSPIFSLIPRFVQTPEELAFDHEIKLQLKAVFGISHGRCGEKRLGKHPYTFRSQERIAKEDAGISYGYYKHLVRELREAGWLTIIKRGQGKASIIVLHAYKGQKVPEILKKEFKKKVKQMVKNFRR